MTLHMHGCGFRPLFLVFVSVLRATLAFCGKNPHVFLSITNDFQ